jgi:hypothetical protein
MRFAHHELRIDLKDDWWAEAEMGGFVPASSAYRTDASFSKNGEPILEVCIADVGPISPERRAMASSEIARKGFPPESACLKSSEVFGWAKRFRLSADNTSFIALATPAGWLYEPETPAETDSERSGQ